MKILEFLTFREKLKVTELNRESSTLHILEMNMYESPKHHIPITNCLWNLSITDTILSQKKYELLESLELEGDKHKINSFKYLTKLKTLSTYDMYEHFNDLPVNLISLSCTIFNMKDINLNYLNNLTSLTILIYNTFSLESINELINLKKLKIMGTNSIENLNFPNLEDLGFYWNKKINYDKCFKLHTLNIYIPLNIDKKLKVSTHNITNLSIESYNKIKINISDITKLKYLKLHVGNHFYDFSNSCLEEVEISEACVKLPTSIIKLSISESDISNLTNLTNLTYLEINDNLIKPDTLIHLTKLKTLYIT